jgi:hypothetical protein
MATLLSYHSRNLPESATPEQFWEILCIRDKDYLSLKQGTLITPEMVTAWNQQTFTSGNSSQVHQTKTPRNKQEKSNNLTPETSSQFHQEPPRKES